MRKIEKYKPAVMNSLLLFLCGIVWDCVGIVLLILAFSWLLLKPNTHFVLFTGTGVLLALLAHHFGFLRIVDANMKRILKTDDRKCLFSFIPWKSYLMIMVMITFGIILRHSSIPKEYLAILYIGIGFALILSSVRYMRIFLREIKKEKLT